MVKLVRGRLVAAAQDAAGGRAALQLRGEHGKLGGVELPFELVACCAERAARRGVIAGVGQARIDIADVPRVGGQLDATR